METEAGTFLEVTCDSGCMVRPVAAAFPWWAEGAGFAAKGSHMLVADTDTQNNLLNRANPNFAFPIRFADHRGPKPYSSGEFNRALSEGTILRSSTGSQWVRDHFDAGAVGGLLVHPEVFAHIKNRASFLVALETLLEKADQNGLGPWKRELEKRQLALQESWESHTYFLGTNLFRHATEMERMPKHGRHQIQPRPSFTLGSNELDPQLIKVGMKGDSTGVVLGDSTTIADQMIQAAQLNPTSPLAQQIQALGAAYSRSPLDEVAVIHLIEDMNNRFQDVR